MWFSEKSIYNTPEENSFRSNRSTIKNLLNIKNQIQTALVKKKLGMISFDIAKTYDTDGISELFISSTKY